MEFDPILCRDYEAEETVTEFMEALTKDQQMELCQKAKAGRIIHGAFYSELPMDRPPQVCLTLAPLPDTTIQALQPSPYKWDSDKIAEALKLKHPGPHGLVQSAWMAWDSLSADKRTEILSILSQKVDKGLTWKG